MSRVRENRTHGSMWRALETERTRRGICGPWAGALENATTKARSGTTSPDNLQPRQRSTLHEAHWV